MFKLRYFKVWKEDGRTEEVSKEQALDALLTVYKDNDMTRDFLTVVNRIHGVYWDMEVKEDHGSTSVVLIPGLWNMIPVGARYDDNGMRI